MPPRLARLLALVAAVALVGGAFVLRGALAGDDDGNGAASSSSGTDGGSGDLPDGGVRLICDEDLGDAACDAIKALDDVGSVEVLDAKAALQVLGGDEVSYDAWITLDPMPGVLDVARNEDRLEPVAEGSPIPLASSSLAVLTYEDQRLRCDEPIDWECLAGVAPIDAIGLPTLTTATGTLVLGGAATGLLGADFGIDQVRTGAVRTQLAGLADSAPGTLADQARDATRPGQFTALVSTAGLAGKTAGTSQGSQQGLVALDLAPEATIGVVLAPIGTNGGTAINRLKEGVTDQTVRDALAEAGWTGEPLPTEGLPEPDLLYALTTEFG